MVVRARQTKSRPGTTLTPPTAVHGQPVAQSATHNLIQRARSDPHSLSPGELLQLQRVLGNQAATRLLLANGHGAANDRGPKPAPTSPGAIQRKVVRGDLKNLGAGAAGQWHQGNDKFHVTVYGDDPKESGKRGFAFISDRWTSEFHVTDHRPTTPFGRRFYNIDDGSPVVAADQGQVGKPIDDLAEAFMLAKVNALKHYSDIEAAELQRQWEEAEKQQGSERVETMRKVIISQAAEQVGKEIDWTKPQSYALIGRVTTALRELKIELEPKEREWLKTEFDACLNRLNEEAVKERQAKEEEERLRQEALIVPKEVTPKLVPSSVQPQEDKAKQLSPSSSSMRPLVVMILVMLLAVFVGIWRMLR